MACEARLEAGRVLVEGRPTGLGSEDGQALRLRAYPWFEGSILLGVGSLYPWLSWERGGVEADTLWRVFCDAPGQPELFLRVEGANFGWSERSADGRSLYFTLVAAGVQRYDFGRGDFGPLGLQRDIDQCWMAEPQDPSVRAEEVVAGWVREDELLVYSGGPCGFEASWEGVAEVFELSPVCEIEARRPLAHVGSVAAGAGGVAWASDGGLCSEGVTAVHAGSPGLWRSVDQGQRWSLVEIPGLGTRAIDAVWAALDAPERLLARSECCFEDAADYCLGGKLFYSEDSGERWTALNPAVAVAGVDPNDPWALGPLVGVRLGPKGEIIEAETCSIEGGFALRSDDGGRHWRAQPSSVCERRGAAGDGALQRVRVGAWILEASPDGVVRRSASNPEAAGVSVHLDRAQP